MTGPAWKMYKMELNAYKKINIYFFKIRDRIEKLYDYDYQNIRERNSNKKIVGVVARGTDYLILKPKGHPIQPELSELFKQIKKNVHETDVLYVATDEQKILNQFIREFGSERIITTESEYYDNVYHMKEANVSRLTFERENDKFLKGYQYFERIYILSKVDGLIAGMSGAVRATLIMNRDVFPIEIIIWKGLYK